MSYLEVEPGEWNTFVFSLKPSRRKDDFQPYTEPFRLLNGEEIISLMRNPPFGWSATQKILVSYRASSGGFTVCDIVRFNKLYSASSHCIKSDRWLKVRGQMIAFRRALESEGVDIPQESEKYFVSDGLVYSGE